MSRKKKKHSKSKSKSNKLRSRFSLFRDDRFRYALGIVFILFAFYLFLSFISYFFQWQTDQDFRWAEIFSGPEITVENQGGKWGAWLSDTFMNRWFGIPSLLFPAILIVWALGLFRLRILKTWTVTRNLLILIILSSVTLGVIFGSASGYLGSGPGGMHGYHISRWMIAAMGVAGTGSVLLILFSVFALFTTPILHRLREKKELLAAKTGEESGFDTDSPDVETDDEKTALVTSFEQAEKRDKAPGEGHIPD